MNAEEAIGYIHAHHWKEHRPGLTRIRRLLDALGRPQDRLRFVHVAGTNGKGSTCACIAAVLQTAGYRVGLNTSPYLIRFNERIQVNGAMISDEELADLVAQIQPAADQMEEAPTEFELITAAAFLYFERKQCDIVVLEVGLGGALDASNVISCPEAAVITAMGMDHERELGPTMADIAAAKAGIIKEGGSVVSYGGVPEADAVIEQTCREKHAALTRTDFSRLHEQSCTIQENQFDFAPYSNVHLPLLGAYQIRNAAVAITTLEVLRRKGWKISDAAILQGLAAVQWPGRLEVLRRSPLFLLDGAHNPHGVSAVIQSLKELFPDRKMVFLVGAMADKRVEEMMKLLAPEALAFVAVTPDTPRAMSAGDLYRLIARMGKPVQACGSVAQGVETAELAAGADGIVCALGTLYFSGDVRRAVQQQKN